MIVRNEIAVAGFLGTTAPLTRHFKNDYAQSH